MINITIRAYFSEQMNRFPREGSSYPTRLSHENASKVG